MAKKPIWKRAGKEIEHASAHLGKIFDNSNAREIIDMIAAMGSAYLGATTLNKYPTRGALMGLISYKLATTEGNLAQAAGLTGLLMLGAAWGDPTEPGVEQQNFWSQAIKQKCPENSILEWNILKGWHCIPIPTHTIPG